ncbi:MAG: acyl-CoA dehydrogenase family protein [Burkholderiaceae bacterium]
MNQYNPPAQEVSMLLTRVLEVGNVLSSLPAHAEHSDQDLVTQVLSEMAKFVREVVAPLNRDGDEVGCVFDNGSVVTPPGFADAYRQFWQAGWPAIATAPEDGGQGLPAVLEAVMYEWLNGANHGWTMAPGLLHGAYECIKHHASDNLKSGYLEKVATGEWLATMCLTEPHAGSDLGLVRTKAAPQPNGSYELEGTKIFISGGEHDLTENIVHLVLARLPDAPPGPKGLSLFLAPKFLEDGKRNEVQCERIEEKMGLHGSPTCVMRFDGAKAWLVGEHGRGLNAMFLMMNSARLHVALQGIGLLDAAHQKAYTYAQQRMQMRAPVRADAKAPADPIIQHPAVKRALDTQRVWVDGGRIIAYQTALELDIVKHHPDSDRRGEAEAWASLITPVLKAAWTEQAFVGASACLQVFGGHGYVREWGIEQIVRDSRVSMIYEGTNEIQANDLLLRKVLGDGGQQYQNLLNKLLQDLADESPLVQKLKTQCAKLAATVDNLSTAQRDAPDLAHWIASDFLKATALTLLTWAWCKINKTSLANGSYSTALVAWVLPEFDMRLSTIESLIAKTTSAQTISAA